MCTIIYFSVHHTHVSVKLGKSNIYVEQTLDSSQWSDISVNMDAATDNLNNNEYGIFETECDGNILQTTQFNYAVKDATNYTQCFALNDTLCSSLTIRVGGYLGGAGDSVFVSKIDIHFVTAAPTFSPTFSPSQPTKSPTIPTKGKQFVSFSVINNSSHIQLTSFRADTRSNEKFCASC